MQFFKTYYCSMIIFSIFTTYIQQGGQGRNATTLSVHPVNTTCTIIIFNFFFAIKFICIFWEGHKIWRNLHLSFDVKVHIFWEGHKILRNLPLTFDCIYCSQKLGEDFANFCGLLRLYELYIHINFKIYSRLLTCLIGHSSLYLFHCKFLDCYMYSSNLWNYIFFVRSCIFVITCTLVNSVISDTYY